MNRLHITLTRRLPVESTLGTSYSHRNTHSHSLNSRKQHPTTCRATDPYLLQDISIGALVIGSVGFSLAAGLGREKCVCDLCQGVGGSRCFGCQGNGQLVKTREQLDAIEREEASGGPPTPRDFFGLSPEDPGKCKVCNGFGLIPCSRCKAKGYV